MATDKRTGGGAGGTGGRQRQTPTRSGPPTNALELAQDAGPAYDAARFRQLNTKAEQDAFMDAFNAQLQPTLNQTQKNIIGQYQFQDYKEINNTLRDAFENDWSELPQKVNRKVEAIDRALENSRTPEDLVAYRSWSYGEDADNFIRMAQDGSLRGLINRGGAVYTDAGYQSTTLKPEGANMKFRSAKIQTRILVPRGSKAIPVRTNNLSDLEQEILLDRGATYRIRDYTMTQFQGRDQLILDVEYVGTNPQRPQTAREKKARG